MINDALCTCIPVVAMYNPVPTIFIGVMAIIMMS